MSGEPNAKRDLAEALLKSADEAWSVVYDWVKEKIGPGENEEEEEGGGPGARPFRGDGDQPVRIADPAQAVG